MYPMVFFALVAVSAVFSTEEEILELPDNHFNKEIAKHEVVLVMFYHPLCGHCQHLKPEYTKAAIELARNDPPITLVTVDCSETGTQTCDKHKIKKHPTLKIFRNGKFWQNYDGQKVASAIVSYMKAQIGPASMELANVKELENFLKERQDAFVIGFFETDTALKTAFLEVADRMRGKVRFGHSSCKDVLDQQETTDGIVLFRPLHMRNEHEEDSFVYSGDAISSKIERFIRHNYHGLVDHRRIDNRHTFRLPLTIVYYAGDLMKNTTSINYCRKTVLKVAERYRGKMNFVVSSKSDFQDELNKLDIGFVNDEKPIVVTWQLTKVRYIMKDEFSAEALSNFVKDIRDAKLQPYMKSEPIPESNYGPVKVAVAHNFDEMVTKNGKDTVIEFYAPWCKHCQRVAPIYEKLAKRLSGEDVVFLKMDVAANDVAQPYEVREIPTLYFAARNLKSTPVKYVGEHELDDFIKFVAKHATKELMGYDRAGRAKKTEL